MIIPDQLYSKIIDVMPIPCVDLLVVDRHRNILMLKRKNEPAQGQWWLPGGRVHFGETRHAAAIRKLYEECRLEADSIQELGTYDLILDVPGRKNGSHGITTLFYAQIVDRNALFLDKQSEKAKWLQIDEWKGQSLHPFINYALSRV